MSRSRTSIVLIALVVALTTAGCSKAVDASPSSAPTAAATGSSTSTAPGVTTSTSAIATPTTATASLAKERERLETVHDALPNYTLDGVEPVALTVGGMTSKADLVFTGRVVALDEQTAYLEPKEVLKGTPLFGMPIAFRCQAGTASHPFYLASVLKEGDDLLIFARYYDQVPDDPYLKEKYRAYLLFESEFMKVGEEYANIKNTSWRTTVEEVGSLSHR